MKEIEHAGRWHYALKKRKKTVGLPDTKSPDDDRRQVSAIGRGRPQGWEWAMRALLSLTKTDDWG